jgi:putative transposase
MDGYTREALRIEPDTSLPGLRVVRVLEGLREKRGTPAAIQVDNGTEFTSRVVDQWAYQNQVALHFIERGKPTQNASIESFNGKFREEWFPRAWQTIFPGRPSKSQSVPARTCVKGTQEWQAA